MQCRKGHFIGQMQIYNAITQFNTFVMKSSCLKFPIYLIIMLAILLWGSSVLPHMHKHTVMYMSIHHACMYRKASAISWIRIRTSMNSPNVISSCGPVLTSFLAFSVSTSSSPKLSLWMHAVKHLYVGKPELYVPFICMDGTCIHLCCRNGSLIVSISFRGDHALAIWGRLHFKAPMRYTCAQMVGDAVHFTVRTVP